MEQKMILPDKVIWLVVAAALAVLFILAIKHPDAVREIIWAIFRGFAQIKG